MLKNGVKKWGQSQISMRIRCKIHAMTTKIDSDPIFSPHFFYDDEN